MVMHRIWESRNTAVFDGIMPNFAAFKHHILSCISELNLSIPGHMHNSVQDLITLKALNLNGRPKAAPKIIEIYWTNPPPGWIKVNTDGMAAGNPGTAAIGGVYRNTRGFFLGAFCGNIGIHNAFFAEISALIHAIELAWKKGWRKIWFEMDSLSTLQCLLDMQSHPPWQLYTRWNNCRFYLSHMQFYASHTYREGNCVADHLSKMGMLHSSIQWWPSPPNEILPFLNNDLLHKPSYRFA